MADSKNFSDSTYRTGSAMSYPIVIKSPYADWRSLCVRKMVKAGASVYIGCLVKLNAAVSTKATAEEVIITSDKALNVCGVVVDCDENIAQLEKDNSGATATKALYFSANSYVWVLPLFPGLVLSGLLAVSNQLEEGNYMCSNATGGVRLLVGIATDVDQQAKIGRSLSDIVSGATLTQWIAYMVI